MSIPLSIITLILCVTFLLISIISWCYCWKYNLHMKTESNEKERRKPIIINRIAFILFILTAIVFVLQIL